MNKDACKDAGLVRDSLIDRNWHAYVRDFIEKIDPCRSMVNLFIGPTPRVRFINSERSHRNCLGNRYYDSSLPGVKPWIYFTVTNHSRSVFLLADTPSDCTLIMRFSILNGIFLAFLSSCWIEILDWTWKQGSQSWQFSQIIEKFIALRYFFILIVKSLDTVLIFFCIHLSTRKL